MSRDSSAKLRVFSGSEPQPSSPSFEEVAMELLEAQPDVDATERLHFPSEADAVFEQPVDDVDPLFGHLPNVEPERSVRENTGVQRRRRAVPPPPPPAALLVRRPSPPTSNDRVDFEVLSSQALSSQPAPYAAAPYNAAPGAANPKKAPHVATWVKLLVLLLATSGGAGLAALMLPKAPANVVRSNVPAAPIPVPAPSLVIEPIAVPSVSAEVVAAPNPIGAQAVTLRQPDTAAPARPAPTPDPELSESREPEPAVDPADAVEAQLPPPSREQVAHAMSRISSDIRACAAGQRGTAQIVFTFSPTGAVRHALVQGDYANRPEGSCMARAARSAQLPPFSEPSLRVRYPFSL